MTNDKWFNEMDGEQAFPSLAATILREFGLVRTENDASHERLRRVVEGLDAHALGAALPGRWTVSALLAHLAWWDRLTLRRWQEFLRSGARPAYVDDAVNDALLPQWLSVPPHDAVGEVLDAAEAVDRLIAACPTPSSRR